MGLSDALNHLLNFAAPALGLALVVALASWAFDRNRPTALSAVARLAINFAVGWLLLAAGLWCFGRDGMVATYAALAVGVATSQWVMVRGWRR